ncbi:MAG: hypothetical protein AB7P37_02075 [Ramlibacter sp.]
MASAQDVSEFMACIQTQLDQARSTISGHQRMRAEVNRVLAQLKPLEQLDDGDLNQYVRSQLHQAQQRPVLPVAHIEADPAAHFARQVRRRNNIV